MTAILGFSELLLMRDVPEELRREWLQAINSDGRRMAAIIESLLNVSTIQSGRLEVVLEPLDLEAVLDGVITSVAAGAPERRIVVDVAAGLPAVVADSGKLVEVLSNLVGNALKYSPAGGAVSIEARTDGDGRVVVSVTDEGLGIAASDIEQLFTSFHRVRRPETVAIRGTGLGLYIVKSLVEMMNGTIDVCSELNVGSTFRVTFPAEAVGRFRLAS
ncbi:MAG: HAMP domain-containing sensor histidine kinase [Chloroflexi bacterium]|nr:HAMP domain-containing sensor histidine kinase [Chloroflexota bacterium]MDA1174194.1 HAMP domain-containing sensor histidine kinase [Chloroflexota bacterium]